MGSALLFALNACTAPVPEVPPLQKARQALAAGDGLAAEVILRDMLAQGTPKEELAAYLGEAELQQEQAPEARQWLESGGFSPETRGRGFHMLGRLEMLDSNLPQAGQAFDEALKSIPDDPELWVDIGRLRYEGGEQMQAVEAGIKAVKLGPTNPKALQFRAQLVRDAKGMMAALPWYEAALEHNPDNLSLLGDYAATLGEAGYTKDMLVIVRRMVELNERNPQAFYLQAVLAARGGHFDLAGNLLARSGELERERPAAMLLSAIVDMENGNFASASQTLDLMATRQPDNERVRLLLARSLSLGGNHRELVYRFGEIATKPGTAPYLVMLVGRSYEVLGQRDVAARYLDFAARPRVVALTVLPPNAPLDVAALRGTQTGGDAVTLVRGLLAQGNSVVAIDAAQSFVRRAPGSADALGLAGDAQFAAGNAQRAADMYTKSATIRRPWPLIRRMSAAFRRAGKSKTALTLIEDRLESDSANTEAAIMLAEAAMSSGDPELAEIYLDLAIANGAGRDPHALTLRAKAAWALGDRAKAQGDAMRAYRLQRMGTETTGTLAQILADGDDGAAQGRALRTKLKVLSAGS